MAVLKAIAHVDLECPPVPWSQFFSGGKGLCEGEATQIRISSSFMCLSTLKRTFGCHPLRLANPHHHHIMHSNNTDVISSHEEMGDKQWQAVGGLAKCNYIPFHMVSHTGTALCTRHAVRGRQATMFDIRSVSREGCMPATGCQQKSRPSLGLPMLPPGKI